MKNKKGMTIAELIVSIVLVSVACIYFFQTIVSINKLYSTVNEDTNDYLHRLYLLRLADAYKEENNNMNNFNSDLANYDLPSEYLDNSGELAINYDNGTFMKDEKIITFFALDNSYSDSGGGDSQDNENQDNDDDSGDEGSNDIVPGGEFPEDGEVEDNTSNNNDDCSDIYCTMYKIGEDEGITEGDCMEYSSLSDNSKNLLNDYNSLPKENASICYISKSDENKENKNNVSETYSYSTKKYEYCVFGVVSSYSNNTNSCKKRKF